MTNFVRQSAIKIAVKTIAKLRLNNKFHLDEYILLGGI